MSSEFLLLDLMKELNITTKDLLTAEKAFLPNGKLSLKVVICIDGKDYLTDDIDILRKDSYLARGVIIGNYFFSFKNKWQEEKTQIPCNQMEKLPTKEQVMILSENYEKYKALAKFCQKKYHQSSGYKIPENNGKDHVDVFLFEEKRNLTEKHSFNFIIVAPFSSLNL